MQNITMKIVKNKLTIEVDLSKSLGRSASGKSEVIASTKGNIDVPGSNGAKIGLNIYKPV